MIKKLSFLVLFMCTTLFTAQVFAAKTYTPAQLNKMVAGKKFPKVGSPKVSAQAAEFGDCRGLVGPTVVSSYL